MSTVDTPSPPFAVPVTGIGAVTASGTCVGDLFDDLSKGLHRFSSAPVPGVANALPRAPHAVSDGAEERPVLAGHVRAALPLADVVGARVDRSLSRDSRLLIHAAHTAQPDPAARPGRTGVVLGTLHAGRTEYLAIHAAAGVRGPVNPVWGPHSGYNAAAAQLSILMAAQGPNITLCAGATTGLDAVVAAAGYVRAGTCDTMVAAGLDTLSAAVPTVPGTAPADGTTPPGEAAAAVVLGSAGVGRVLANLLGAGQAVAGTAATEYRTEPTGTAPTGTAQLGTAQLGTAVPTGALAQAAEESLRQALFRSGRPAAEVGTAVIAGTGDPQVDAAVRRALGAVLGEQLHICDVTLASGRTGGADGTLAVAIAVEALCRGVVPTQGLPRTGTLVVCLAADRTGSTTALVLTGATAGPDASTVRGATTVRDTTTGPGERT